MTLAQELFGDNDAVLVAGVNTAACVDGPLVFDDVWVLIGSVRCALCAEVLSDTSLVARKISLNSITFI